MNIGKVISIDWRRILPGKVKKVLREGLGRLQILFWLDAHYSGTGTARGRKDTPIARELKAILTHRVRNHIIIIDDARLFNGQNSYPKLTWLRKLIKEKYP